MLGLFGTLSLGTRSLSVQRQATEVVGHNLANVNNPAYARQRLVLATSLSVTTQLGQQGTGADSVRIQQIRDGLLDGQIQSETSVRGSLDAQQKALDYVQASLGQRVDRQSTGAEGAAAAGGVTSQHGLAEHLSDLFNAFQSLSTNPTSLSERQVVLQKAQDLATQFNQVSQRLSGIATKLDDTLQVDAASANAVLADLAKLNQQIMAAETGSTGPANDLRDQRQQKIEDLAKLVNIKTVTLPNGSVDVTIGGVTMVTAGTVADRLEVYDAGAGQKLIRAQTAGTPLALTSGSIQGTIDVRDGALANLRTGVNTLAATLVTEVNTLHTAGYGLTGTTGANFFTGTDAATIKVNAALAADPSLVQASAVSGTTGDNQVALALAQLGQKKIPALGGQTLSDRYGQTVAALGQSLSSVNLQIGNQDVVQGMLERQRDSNSGVSLDEEMSDMIRFQKAFEASARLINTVDEMLGVVVNLGRA